MKKLAVLAGVLAVLVCGTGAWATLVSITFDETFVSYGTTDSRYDGTQLSSQYSGSPYFVTWTDIYHSGTNTDNPSYTGQVVCTGAEFSGSGYTTGNFAWIYGANAGSGTSMATAVVTLSVASNYFSIDYRRPNAGGQMEFTLLSDGKVVADSGILITAASWSTWKPSSSGYLAEDITFNEVRIWQGDKSLIDNLTFNAVPIPPPILLLAGGLGGLGFFARRRIKG